MKKVKILSIVTIMVIMATLLFPGIVKATDITQNMTLNQDITDGIVVKSGSTVTLNLNGKSVTNTNGQETIKIEEGATLTITGDGTVTNDTHGKAVILNEGTLTIENGTFARSEIQGKAYYTVVNHGNMTVNGGTIKIESNEKAGWNSSIIDNGWVNGADNVTGKKATLTINGGTIEFEGKNNKYIKNDDYGVIIVNGGTFNANESSSAIIGNIASNAELTVNGGTFNTKNKNQPIWVYAGKATILGGTYNLPEDSLGISDPEIKNFLPSTGETEEKVESFDVIDENGNTTGNKVIAKQSDLKEKAETKVVDQSSIAIEEVKAIEDAVKEKLKENYTIAGYYAIDLFKTINDKTKVEKLDESSKLMKITVNIPQSVEGVKEGYKRAYYIVRIHNGEATILDATENGDGTISFETDKFSTYSLAYADTLTKTEDDSKKDENKDNSSEENKGNNSDENNKSDENSEENAKEENNKEENNVEDTSNSSNPTTGDTIFLFVTIFVIALAGTIITLKINKKNNVNKKH